MPRKTKISEATNEEGYSVVPKEVIPQEDNLPIVAPTAVKNKIKREMSEAQRLNMVKMVEANKIKWEEKRKAKAQLEQEAKAKRKAEEDALINAGTHIRVKIAPKREYKKREKPTQQEETAKEEEDEEDEEDEDDFQAPQVKPKSRKARQPISDTDTTETETDGEEYKSKKRAVRREVKKNLSALKKIDEVLEQSAGNPYVAFLAQRWK